MHVQKLYANHIKYKVVDNFFRRQQGKEEALVELMPSQHLIEVLRVASQPPHYTGGN